MLQNQEQRETRRQWSHTIKRKTGRTRPRIIQTPENQNEILLILKRLCANLANRRHCLKSIKTLFCCCYFRLIVTFFEKKYTNDNPLAVRKLMIANSLSNALLVCPNPLTVCPKTLMICSNALTDCSYNLTVTSKQLMISLSNVWLLLLTVLWKSPLMNGHIEMQTTQTADCVLFFLLVP